MSQGLQTSVNARTTDGVTYVATNNTNTSAFNSMQAGPQPPTTAELGTQWLNTQNGSFPVVEVHDGTGWVSCIVVDATNHRPRFILDADHDTYIEGTGVDGAARIVSESAQIVGISSSGISVGTATPAVSIDCAGQTDAIQLPAGPDSAAPAATAGRMRWSTTSNSVKVANGSTWGALTGGGSGVSSLGAIPGVTISNQLSGQALVATGGTNWGNGAVGSSGIGAAAINSTHFSAGAVSHAALGTRVVEGENVASGTLLTSHLSVTGSAAHTGDIPAAQANGSVEWITNAYNNTRRETGSRAFAAGSTGFTGTTSFSTTLTEMHIYINDLQFQNLGNPLAARGYTRLRFDTFPNRQGSDYEWASYWSNVEFDTRSIDNIIEIGPAGPNADGLILLGHQNHNQQVAARIVLRLVGSIWTIEANVSRRTGRDSTLATAMGAFTLASGYRITNFELDALPSAGAGTRTYNGGRVDYTFLHGT